MDRSCSGQSRTIDHLYQILTRSSLNHVDVLQENMTKRLGTFLIHRYLGAWLKEKLTLEQLNVDLGSGTGKISHVNIDAQVTFSANFQLVRILQLVNEQLSALRLPVQLVDGYIGELVIGVPWKELMTSSCTMQVRRRSQTLLC